VVREIAEAKGATVSQVALAWCAAQPGITSPIIGPRTMAQLEDNLAALDVELTDDDFARLDEVSPPKQRVVPYYGPWAGADFGPHPHRW
jgi:aryl-alcohol dehydrogenase-like predicted oxidoreductase